MDTGVIRLLAGSSNVVQQRIHARHDKSIAWSEIDAQGQALGCRGERRGSAMFRCELELEKGKGRSHKAAQVGRHVRSDRREADTKTMSHKMKRLTRHSAPPNEDCSCFQCRLLNEVIRNGRVGAQQEKNALVKVIVEVLQSKTADGSQFLVDCQLAPQASEKAPLAKLSDKVSQA